MTSASSFGYLSTVVHTGLILTDSFYSNKSLPSAYIVSHQIVKANISVVENIINLTQIVSISKYSYASGIGIKLP